MMVNYKIVNDKQMIDIGAGYVEIGGDILETKTDQIVKRGLGIRKAKDLVRHLNFGGGFDGSTPAFFLAESAKMLDSNEKRV
jgi:hypothetical protein